MNRRLILALVLTALFALFAWQFFGGTESSTSAPEGGSEIAAETGDEPRDRRTILPQKFPDSEEKGEETTEPKVSRFTMQIAEQPALSGIELAASTEDDRKRAGVTGKYGQGVTVTRIHPDSSAAEVSMEIGDVIVRAQKENVNSIEDLQRIVGDRDHTVVNFMRDGELMSVVLQRPFRKPAP
jgi:hypothetical protein